VFYFTCNHSITHETWRAENLLHSWMGQPCCRPGAWNSSRNWVFRSKLIRLASRLVALCSTRSPYYSNDTAHGPATARICTPKRQG